MSNNRIVSAKSDRLFSMLRSVVAGSDLFSLPTETVYGLAGNAYDDKAILKIYQLKQRPISSPLIIHYADFEKLSLDVEVDDIALKLAKEFMPGPLTLILKQRSTSKLSKFVNNSSSYLAVRIPSHPVANEVISKLDLPLAAPSANKFTQTSPVLAEHVLASFANDNNPKLIIDAGQASYGLESTIVFVDKEQAYLQREGMISFDKLKETLQDRLHKQSDKIKNPGQSQIHYNPGYKIRLNAKQLKPGELGLAFCGVPSGSNFDLSTTGNLEEAAYNLYLYLHKYKQLDCKKLAIGEIPLTGIGLALNDKIYRASQSYHGKKTRN